jgi:hypothetical protein
MVMERNKHKQDLLHRLGGVSHKVIDNHHLENLSEFVLHDLCSDDLLNVGKAAYLVNNPDFLCMKGIVGWNNREAFDKGIGWDHQKDFTSHMRQASFNQKVRQFNDLNSSIRGLSLDKAKVVQLADQLEIENPFYHVWNMKHANQGILIFEKKNENEELFEHLPYFVSILSFCPIF